jgi:pimeloyl-ACP methyl ester carboxylesterase
LTSSRPAGTVRSADGTPIAFDRAGDGPVLILVVGALCDRASNGPLAAALAPHFTVYNYDRRGRGASGNTAPYAAEKEIEDLAAVLGAAGGSALVYGHSSGAALALEAAARGPRHQPAGPAARVPGARQARSSARTIPSPNASSRRCW